MPTLFRQIILKDLCPTDIARRVRGVDALRFQAGLAGRTLAVVLLLLFNNPQPIIKKKV